MESEAGGGPGAAVIGSTETGLNFYRPHARVVVLLFLAPVAYEVWWYWQLFLFTRREGFPRTQSFWWILVPIYGWIVIYRQFDDLATADDEFRPAFSSTGAIWLVVLSQVVGNASLRIAPIPSFVAFVLSSIFIAWAGHLVQPHANNYLRRRYPDAKPLPMTTGEIVATVIGVLAFALVVLATFAWS